MNWIFRRIRGILRILTNPVNFYYNNICPRFRHYRFPDCDSTAIVNNPILFDPSGVKLGKNVSIFKNGRISCIFEFAGVRFNPVLEIKSNTTIQQNVHITCAKHIIIGDSCAITHNVTITDIDHTYECFPESVLHPNLNKIEVHDVEIGSKCMIFPNSVILGGTKIGNNCVVAANSVVRGVFPNNCLIGGAPAKVLKRLNPETGIWERTNSDGSFKTEYSN